MKYKEKSKWYSSKLLFSHNAFINFVMSPRGNGKTFDGKKRIVENWKKNRKQSVYIRRRDSEFKKSKDKFWNDIKPLYPDDEFAVEGYEGFINGEVVVYFIPLSTSFNMKSTPYPDVTLIMFDEYVIPKTSNSTYLKNEMLLFHELLETIIRLRDDVKIYFCANAISFVNPFFTYYNIEPEPNKRFQKFYGGLICLELFTNEVFIEEKLKTSLGKLIHGTKYGDYAINNMVLEDTEDFIRERSGNMVFVSAFKSDNFTVGIWFTETGDYYCDKKIDPSSKHKFAVRINDVEPQFTHLREGKKNNWRVSEVRKAYDTGKLYFSTQEVKKFFQDFVSPYL